MLIGIFIPGHPGVTRAPTEVDTTAISSDRQEAGVDLSQQRIHPDGRSSQDGPEGGQTVGDDAQNRCVGSGEADLAEGHGKAVELGLKSGGEVGQSGDRDAGRVKSRGAGDGGGGRARRSGLVGSIGEDNSGAAQGTQGGTHKAILDS